MGALEVIALLEAAAKAGIELYNAYEEGKVVLSEQDAAAVHAKLLEVEAVTASLRPKVDAALLAASQR